ncbi:hypothetical protein [Paenibacillus eucommiae]|uniref:Uncharacterized protein n=1 Tax=Paenibacillus eucommiae TaxID=1355755 RepID=A0ABS4IN94_9BACL|nr:hypothetical protein [Paenibacillus eucommiae]MBP1989025.1 hypothetical protein [Paenibacillus eucommiae]
MIREDFLAAAGAGDEEREMNCTLAMFFIAKGTGACPHRYFNDEKHR